jgi:6-phospho-beta-glucosidase
VVGICDSPLGAARRVASAAGVDLADVTLDYAGLNHLGWLRAVHHDGRDLLADLLADDAALAATEEGQLFGVEWLRTLGALPNEYLYYYYFTRDAVAAVTAARQTRGEYLLEQQRAFYAALSGRPGGAWETWEAVRRERNATYMREAREAESERDEQDVAGGGYEGVAVALMAAVTGGAPATLVLNVRGGGVLPGLPADAVVEVPCRVDADGPRPLPVAPLEGHPLGLVQQVKAVERLAIEAALTGSERLAVEAFALHPLVDSVTVARELLRGYRARIPLVDAVFRR